jgi:hypothetical protein
VQTGQLVDLSAGSHCLMALLVNQSVYRYPMLLLATEQLTHT